MHFDACAGYVIIINTTKELFVCHSLIMLFNSPSIVGYPRPNHYHTCYVVIYGGYPMMFTQMLDQTPTLYIIQ